MATDPTVSQSAMSPREGFKLLGEHRDGCRAVARGDGMPFVITDKNRPFDFARKKNGQRGGSTMHWRFVCNDIDCPALLLVRWDRIMHFINGIEALDA